MTRFISTIEYIEKVSNETDATDALQFLATQVDYLGGRILQPLPNRPEYTVQAFFEDVPEAMLLPDGCNRRITPVSMLSRAS